MKTMTESELRAGVIFGDNISDEYVYMPASELGVENPICVYPPKKSKASKTSKIGRKLLLKKHDARSQSKSD